MKMTKKQKKQAAYAIIYHLLQGIDADAFNQNKAIDLTDDEEDVFKLIKELSDKYHNEFCHIAHVPYIIRSVRDKK